MADTPRTLRIAVLASHGGSNLQAILDAVARGDLPARVVIVVGNNSGTKAFERARAAGVPVLHLSAATHPDAGALDRAMADAILASGADVVALAGYMKKIGPLTLAAFRGRIVNIHPSLLPRHGGPGMFGIHPHEAALAAGDRESGATVHVVDEEYDKGPVLAQSRAPILPGDTAETLQQRVLEIEHQLYLATLARIARGEIRLEGLDLT